MSYEFFMRQAMQQYLAETTKKPHLTIINNEIKTTQGDATMEESTEDKKAELKAIFTEAAAVPARPLHEHGAFSDIYAAVDLLALGADALKGIGAMMQPAMERDDVQIEEARRSDMAAIFKFFGEVLREPAITANEAADRLERAAKGQVT